METELLQADYHSTEQPHFDEEWTVLTARPVVPLKEVEIARTKHRKVRLIALFAAAIVLGAASALIVVSFERSRGVSLSAVDSDQNDAVSSQQTPQASASEETAAATQPATPTEVSTYIAPKTVAVVREKAKASSRQSQKESDQTTQDKAPAENASEAGQPRAMLFDEIRGHWEERRARRIRRQERRERAGRRGRDLLRIDEIFEGPRP